jgi:hypothetical protein
MFLLDEPTPWHWKHFVLGWDWILLMMSALTSALALFIYKVDSSVKCKTSIYVRNQFSTLHCWEINFKSISQTLNFVHMTLLRNQHLHKSGDINDIVIPNFSSIILQDLIERDTTQYSVWNEVVFLKVSTWICKVFCLGNVKQSGSLDCFNGLDFVNCV